MRTRPSTRALTAGFSALLLLSIPVAAGASPSAAKRGRPVNVRLREFSVKARPASVPAGTVRFGVRNAGGEEHELVVVKTDGIAPPTLPDGSVNEDVIPEDAKFGEVEDLGPKDRGSLTAKGLTPGQYLLFCNVVDNSSSPPLSHYAEGMYTLLTVR